MTIALNTDELTNIEDPAALVAWALGFASDSVRRGDHDAELDGSDRGLIADALMHLAHQADSSMGDSPTHT